MILAPLVERYADFSAEHALPLVVRYLPDVRATLAIALANGELDERTAAVVRAAIANVNGAG